jgi:hypothetical protein
MVLAALSRLAATGAWQHILDGTPLCEDVDVVDAEFLVAAGAITRVGDVTFQSAVDDPMYTNPQALGNWAQYLLRRALQHATGQGMEWASEDPETILSFGRASGRGADVIADVLLPRLPTSQVHLPRDVRLSSMSGLASERFRSGSSSDTQGRAR